MMNRFMAAVVLTGAVSASFAHEFRETPIVAHWTGAENGDWAAEKALPSVTGIPQGSEFQLRRSGTTLKLKEPVGALLIVR